MPYGFSFLGGGGDKPLLLGGRMLCVTAKYILFQHKAKLGRLAAFFSILADVNKQ